MDPSSSSRLYIQCMSWLAYFNSSPFSQNKAAMAHAESKIIFKFRFNFMCFSQEKKFEFPFHLTPAGAEKFMSRLAYFRPSPYSQNKAGIAHMNFKITVTVHIIGPGYSREMDFNFSFVPPLSVGDEKTGEYEDFFEKAITYVITTLINYISIVNVTPDSIKKALESLKAKVKELTDVLYSLWKKALAWLKAFLNQLTDVLYSLWMKALAWLEAFLNQLTDVLYTLWKKGLALLNDSLKSLACLTDGFFSWIKEGIAWLGFIKVAPCSY